MSEVKGREVLEKQDQWASKLGFILATAGSAIGLGAIWKFPYVAGTGGGGAFLLLFLIFTFLLGYPLLVGEFTIGRHAQSDAIRTYKKLAPHTWWHVTGRIGVLVSFLVLSFYSVVGGWILLYLIQALSGNLSGLSQAEYGTLFSDIIANPAQTIIAQFVFILLTILVVAKGIQQGIEKVSKIMMPILFILFILLVVRSLMLPGAGEGVRFLFVPDFAKLTSQTVLYALGQAFFTLTLGVSVMVTYSSYLPKTQNIPKSALSITLLNTFITLLAGLAIFPGAFTFNIQPTAGPPLIFVVLPAVFENVPFGSVIFIAFLLLLLFAALTSAFSMIEIIVATVIKDQDQKRAKMTWLIGIAIFIVGIPSCLSYGVLADFKMFDKTIFDLVDFITSNVLMPIGALLISLFISIKVKRSTLMAELQEGSNIKQGFFNVWFFLLRFVTPIAIILVLLDSLGVFNRFK